MTEKPRTSSLPGGLLRLARPKHWIKNLLVFLPVLFSRNLFHPAMLGRALGGFLAFSLLASSIYVVNDLRDAESDRLHEGKKHRPIASGLVGRGAALGLWAGLLAGGLALNAVVVGLDIKAWAYYLLYLAINLLYSFGVKNVPLADVVILAAGFVLRVLYGGAVVQVAISQWLYLVIIAFSFFLSFGKRRNELIMVGDAARKALKQGYTRGFLDKTMYLCLGLTIVFYALWCVDAQNRPGLAGEGLVWSIPLVLLVCIRYSMDVEQEGSHADPVEVLLADKLLMALVAVYGLVMLVVLYGAQLARLVGLAP